MTREGSENETMITAEEVKEIRLTLGLTQRAFAAKLGVHPRTVRGWESGEYSPRVGVLVAKLRRMAQKVHA